MPSVKESSARAPRFFCEHCGAEVARNAKACPRCGRFFASVRCPACGFAGAEALFKGGCPVCGYSSSGLPLPPGPGERKKPLSPSGPLPAWVYVLSVIALILVLVLLYTIIR
ncbi:MAG: zinc ribbon domain-containing protein [Treponema sp.]|nr:zinc ribbon domain-containing protein [Treponema sp.]